MYWMMLTPWVANVVDRNKVADVELLRGEIKAHHQGLQNFRR